MAKAKKKSPVRRSDPKGPALPPPSLAPKVLEEAAQGWLQSSGAATPAHRPTRASFDHRLTEALAETLQHLRAELTELRARLDRLESR